MAAIRFPEFMRRFRLQLLGVSQSDILPGAVLDRQRRGYLYHGHLSEVLTRRAPAFWATELNAANIVYGSVQRTLSLEGKASMEEMGVSIGGGLARARRVRFSISKVSARTFENGPGHASMFSLTPLIAELRRADRARWRLVNGKWIVLETYYALEALVSFEADAGVDIKTEVEAAGGASAGTQGDLEWKNKRQFELTENAQVPFAFRGWNV